jgi:hypothetical protein
MTNRCAACEKAAHLGQRDEVTQMPKLKTLRHPGNSHRPLHRFRLSSAHVRSQSWDFSGVHSALARSARSLSRSDTGFTVFLLDPG